MSSDWIKMRSDLGDDPAVIAIASQLGVSEFEAVGRLHCLWSWADRHTTNGVVQGVSSEWIDRRVGQGMAAAMEAVGWLSRNCGVVTFPGFDKHNGRTAKERAEDARRKRESRSCPEDVRDESGQTPDENQTRERERERGKSLTSGAREAGSATPMPRRMLLLDEWRAEARRIRPDLTDDEVSTVFYGFRDHYVSNGDKRVDWLAAWCKWVRSERRVGNGAGNGRNGHPAAKSRSEKRADNMDRITGRKTDDRTIDATAERLDSATVLALPGDLRQPRDDDVGGRGPGRAAGGMG